MHCDTDLESGFVEKTLVDASVDVPVAIRFAD